MSNNPQYNPLLDNNPLISSNTGVNNDIPSYGISNDIPSYGISNTINVNNETSFTNNQGTSKKKKSKKKNGPITANDLWVLIQNLPYKYPVDNQTALFLNLPEGDLNNYLKGSWPILPKRVSTLIKNFLEYKSIFGSNTEKAFYKNYNVSRMIKRLLKKRPLVFMGKGDYWHLRTGETGTGSWETIGSDQERYPRIMKNYMTYEEMEFSTFISLSIYTPFINNGSRRNMAIKSSEPHEPEGIYIGQVGCRFEEAQKMEWRFMIVDPQQNLPQFGYGPDAVGPLSYYMKMWASFYGIDHFPNYQEVQSDYSGRFIMLDGYRDVYLDTFIYKKRLRMNAEVFLREADKRASVVGKKAFCHVVGLGLGAWSISNKQDVLTLEMYCELLNEELFPNISDVYFGCFDFDDKNFQLPNSINNIKLHHGEREPFEPQNDPNKLIVANWAWDGCSFVGNEYWEHKLATSGDPSASCCSFVPYIGNPDLNDMKRVYWF